MSSSLEFHKPMTNFTILVTYVKFSFNILSNFCKDVIGLSYHLVFIITKSEHPEYCIYELLTNHSNYILYHKDSQRLDY